jgi:F0F1-type ATP synthase membrane subunit b/b'
LFLLILQSPNDWFGAGKTVTIGAAFFAILGLFIWKGFPWIRAQLEAKDQLLKQEIQDARHERDEARTLRSKEIKQFLAALRRQDQLHKKGFAQLAVALEKQGRKPR